MIMQKPLSFPLWSGSVWAAPPVGHILSLFWILSETNKHIKAVSIKQHGEIRKHWETGIFEKPWPAVVSPVSLFHKHTAIPVLLCAWQAAAVILEPLVIWTIPCYNATLLLHFTYQVTSRYFWDDFQKPQLHSKLNTVIQTNTKKTIWCLQSSEGLMGIFLCGLFICFMTPATADIAT